MLYQVDEECLSEYISYKKLELGCEIVEHLCDLRDVIEDHNTKKFLQEYIDEYSREYSICKNCQGELLPLIRKEPHTELDGGWYEPFVAGYSCENCGNRYDY